MSVKVGMVVAVGIAVVAAAVIAALPLASATHVALSDDHGKKCPTESTADSGSGPLALVFCQGKVADFSDARDLASMLRTSPEHFRVQYVDHDTLTADALSHAQLFAWGGGDVDEEKAKEQYPQEISLVDAFVSRGGRSLWICAGGFLVGSEGFGLMPGTDGSYTDTPNSGFRPGSQKDTAIPITWRDGTTHTVDFQDGNYFSFAPGTPGVTVMGRYKNGEVAAAVAQYGQGKVGFSGPHFESKTSDDGTPTSALDLDFDVLNALGPWNQP